MKKQHSHSVRVSTLRFTLTVALVSIAAIFLTSTLNAQSCGRIDTADVINVQQYFQGLTVISGCSLTAADAVTNGTINTQDVLATQRFYLGFTSGTGHAGNDTGCGLCYGDVTSSTNSPLPAVTVSLPTTNLDTSVSTSTTINVPVVTTNVDPSLGLIGFQGDFTFDERVLTFSPATAPLSSGALLGIYWTVAGNVLPGAGPFRTVRISAFVNDNVSAISGSGTLFNLHMRRVSNTPGDTSNLVWTSSPNDFQFINTIRNTFSPTQNNGVITITSNPTPTPGPSTPTPPPTATPSPGLPTVSAPMFDMSTSDGFAINDQPVISTSIDPSLNLIGFQGDLTFDSAIAAPSPGTNPVAPAGLTASGWSVLGNVLNTGPGTIKTLRISADSLDGNTPLSGTGTLYVIHWKRVSANAGDTTPLSWRAYPEGFLFIDSNLNEFSPSQNNGQITITEQTPNMVNLSGTISHCSNPSSVPASDVTLGLTGTESDSTVSDDSGGYMLSSIAAGGSYTVTPTKDALAPGSAGIATVDMIATQRHFLGMALLTGCALAAADVSGDGNVTTADVIAIQRFYLGFGTGIGNTGKYQFSPASRSYPNVGSDQTNQNYDALIFGDVAGSFANRPVRGSSDAPEENPLTYSSVTSVNLPEIRQSGRDFTVPLSSSVIDVKENLVGFQGDFTFDERVINFETEPVQAAGLTASNWNVAGNILPGQGPIRTLRISAYATNLVPLSGAGTLLYFRIDRVKGGAGSAPLIWAAPPNNFIFINRDLKSQKPANASPGSVTPARQR